MTRSICGLCLLGVMAILVAGCGDSDSTSGGAYGGNGRSTSESSSAETTAANPYSVIGELSVAKVDDLGKILIDRGHHVVYVFHKDRGSTSSCYGACEVNWPPLITEVEPRANEGVDASKLGTTKRKDGVTQVTYGGRPLYTFVKDEAPYEANGNDVTAFGGEWYALQPNGQEPED